MATSAPNSSHRRYGDRHDVTLVFHDVTGEQSGIRFYNPYDISRQCMEFVKDQGSIVVNSRKAELSAIVTHMLGMHGVVDYTSASDWCAEYLSVLIDFCQCLKEAGKLAPIGAMAGPTEGVVFHVRSTLLSP